MADKRMELLFKDEVYAIVGAAFEVYNILGPGFLEAVYQEALSIELAERQIPFAAHEELKITYKGRNLSRGYIPDFLCHNSVVVEIKATECLSSTDQAQLLNYLKAARLQAGVLINFGSAKNLQWKRMIFSNAARVAGITHVPPTRSA
jgi:GxxExxY protein